MIVQGKVWKFGDDLRATDIVSERYDEFSMSKQYAECAKHLLEDVEPRFASEMRPGDIIVAGRNFGAGHAHYYRGAIMGMKHARVGSPRVSMGSSFASPLISGWRPGRFPGCTRW